MGHKQSPLYAEIALNTLISARSSASVSVLASGKNCSTQCGFGLGIRAGSIYRNIADIDINGIVSISAF